VLSSIALFKTSVCVSNLTKSEYCRVYIGDAEASKIFLNIFSQCVIVCRAVLCQGPQFKLDTDVKISSALSAVTVEAILILIQIQMLFSPSSSSTSSSVRQGGEGVGGRLERDCCTYTTPNHIDPHHTTVRYAALHYTALQFTALHCTTLHCTTLHCTS
jgi:hypothetical protein